MRTLIHYACNAASLGQDIGWIELTIRLAFLAAALFGGLAVLLVPSLHDRALNAFLIGFFGYIALATSHPRDDDQGKDND